MHVDDRTVRSSQTNPNSLRGRISSLEEPNETLRAKLLALPAGLAVAETNLSWAILSRISTSPSSRQLLHDTHRMQASISSVPLPAQWDASWVLRFTQMSPEEHRFLLSTTVHAVRAALPGGAVAEAPPYPWLMSLLSKHMAIMDCMQQSNPKTMLHNKHRNIDSGEPVSLRVQEAAWHVAAMSFPLELLKTGSIAKLRVALQRFDMEMAKLHDEWSATQIQLRDCRILAAQGQQQVQQQVQQKQKHRQSDQGSCVASSDTVPLGNDESSTPETVDEESLCASSTDQSSSDQDRSDQGRSDQGSCSGSGGSIKPAEAAHEIPMESRRPQDASVASRRLRDAPMAPQRSHVSVTSGRLDKTRTSSMEELMSRLDQISASEMRERRLFRRLLLTEVVSPVALAYTLVVAYPYVTEAVTIAKLFLRQADNLRCRTQLEAVAPWSLW